jgi:hypothetical protein
MGLTATCPDLLEVCIQDLHAGRKLATAKLPEVAKHASPPLAAIVSALCDDLVGEAKQFEQTDKDLQGPENLWMAGIMDDAVRDTESVEPGPLLDTAIVGAIRKALAADEVSLETASVLAAALEETDLQKMIETMREGRRSTDEELRLLLYAVHAQEP